MKSVLVVTLFFISFATSSAQTSPVFITKAGAINGYDPVAYFKIGKPVPGLKEHSLEWGGATWFFSTKEHKELFQADPNQFAPQYGGYCAFGTADGHKAPTQPDAWSIVDGKLYFNYNKSVRTEWQKNQAELIQKADQNWPTVKDSQ